MLSWPLSWLLGWVARVAGSITVPSLASVYNEFALKKHMDTSVLLQVRQGGHSGLD